MFLQQYDQLVATQCLQHNQPKFNNRSTLFRVDKSMGGGKADLRDTMRVGYDVGFETAIMTIPEMVE